LKGLILSSTDVYYPDLGSTIAGGCRIITAIHSSCASTVKPLQLKWPPLVPPRLLCKFMWEPFNRNEHVILLAWDNKDFAKHDRGLQTLTPAITSDGPAGVLVKYHPHCPKTNALVILGSKVISINKLYPVFNACPNPNIFQHYIGIKSSS
jgi:hypothetical protein